MTAMERKNARPAKKVFDILAEIDRKVIDEIGECYAPYHSETHMAYTKQRFEIAIQAMHASDLHDRDITEHLLDMLENENYHFMYAVCEIWTGRSTLEKELKLFG